MEGKLNQETYTKMKNDILVCALKPGDQVSAAKIAERYHVSRTPAREAIVRLEAEGMVDVYPQSKTVISQIDVHRVRQEWFIRTTLEKGMTDMVFERVTERDLELMETYNLELARAIDRPDDPESPLRYLTSDNDFHAVTYMVAGQRLSAAVISTMMAHYNRLRMLIDFDAAIKQRTLSDHEEILRCLKTRDKDGYRLILEDHFTHIIKDIDIVREAYPSYFAPV